jgi:exodeoxyribonuclease VII large subunit
MSAAALGLAQRVIEPLAPRPAWDVGALLLAADDTLQTRFGPCRVRGELSGLTRAASGHCYFSLKDIAGAGGAGGAGGALLRCAMFRRAAALVDFAPRDGQQVELNGRLSVYEPRGELQLVVESMQRLGAGALYEQFLRLKARLEAAGLFDAARKRALAPWPATLGIVTSTTAAALRDVLTTLARRAPQLRVIVYPSAVQGAGAPAALVAALRLAAQRNEVDTLLLVRGGGSLEDLWCFNDESLVQAIAASPIPIVCGVGHESDVTLADLAADLRAPTRPRPRNWRRRRATTRWRVSALADRLRAACDTAARRSSSGWTRSPCGWAGRPAVAGQRQGLQRSSGGRWPRCATRWPRPRANRSSWASGCIVRCGPAPSIRRSGCKVRRTGWRRWIRSVCWRAATSG